MSRYESSTIRVYPRKRKWFMKVGKTRYRGAEAHCTRDDALDSALFWIHDGRHADSFDGITRLIVYGNPKYWNGKKQTVNFDGTYQNGKWTKEKALTATGKRIAEKVHDCCFE